MRFATQVHLRPKSADSGYGGGGGTPTPTPTPIPALANLVLALDVNDITPQTDNTALASWTDTVGGLVFAQATGANQPLYRTGASGQGVGGRPTLQFSGNQLFTLPKAGAGAALNAVINSLNYTIMIVMHGVTAQANAGTFMTSTSNSGIYLQATSPTSLGQFSTFFSADNDVASSFVTYGMTAVSAGLEDERGYVNGGIVSQRPGPTGSSAAVDFTIGRANLANNGLRGFIDAIYIWDRRLTPLEVMQFDDWCRMSHKWNQASPRTPGSVFYAFDGDSITAGVSASNAKLSYPNITRTAKGKVHGQWSNFAVGGRDWPGMISQQSEISDVVAYLATQGVTVNLAVWEWYNTRLTSPTSTVIGYAQTYLTAAYASGISYIAFGTTCDYGGTPTVGKTTWTSYWDIPANQTGYMDAYVPIHLNANIGVDGAAVAGTGTWFAGDQIHLRGVVGYPGTPSGSPELASLFTPAMP